MKTWGSGGIAPTSLTSALDGGEWSASRPCHFIPWEGVPDTHWIGGWVDPQSRSARCGEEKNPALPGIETVAIPTELSLLFGQILRPKLDFKRYKIVFFISSILR
jgi:hypothetical protein